MTESSSVNALLELVEIGLASGEFLASSSEQVFVSEERVGRRD